MRIKLAHSTAAGWLVAGMIFGAASFLANQFHPFHPGEPGTGGWGRGGQTDPASDASSPNGSLERVEAAGNLYWL